MRVGRRGSLSGTLRVRGVQGHVAYPDKVRNPIHLAAPALAELAATRWDEGNAEFPPTSFQISNIRSGTGALNVVPGEARSALQFPLLHGEYGGRACANAPKRCCASTASTSRWTGIFPANRSSRTTVRCATRWQRRARDLVESYRKADTGGGTSDARFIAPLGAEVVEVGPVNASIHKVDESRRAR